MRRPSTDRRHFIIVGIGIVISTVVVYFLLSSMLPLPTQASAEAIVIDRVINIHLFIIALLFSLVVVFMGYALWVFRRRGDESGEGEHFEGNMKLEVAWTAIPTLAVLLFGFIIGISSLSQIMRAEDNELVVKVTGFQWGWSFEYPNGSVSQELVLPVDQRARMEMTANDVLHAFWVPEFRVKKDLVPGQTTTVRFTPIETGEYSLVCAELCGLSHWSMMAPVRVVEEAEFAQWMQQQLVATSPALADASSR